MPPDPLVVTCVIAVGCLDGVRAKAVLCQNLRGSLDDHINDEQLLDCEKHANAIS